ncbi:uncharacterized protein LOC143378801 [Andrena cerasifolii]|uniref:uncharacterized protein LOC143378801 n=1 Tax=Andrena cerasifolii TaxID=2819439 RepID=UPI00403848F4
MEFFRSFLRVIGLLEPTKVDVISELPLEVSQLILRKLDPESLLCAAQVSRKWLDVCRSDQCLRRSARSYNGDIERQKREEFLGADSPKEARTTEPQRVREVRRVRNPTVLPGNVPLVRFEAAVTFGRVQPPRILPKRSKVKPPTGVRTSRCIRV